MEEEEIKLGQFAVVGKITGRHETMFKDKQYYFVELITSSKYPNVYSFKTCDPQIYGANDQSLAVGCTVRALAWVDGAKETDYLDRATNTRKPLKYPRYSVKFNLISMRAVKVGEPGVPPVESDPGDIPF